MIERRLVIAVGCAESTADRHGSDNCRDHCRAIGRLMRSAQLWSHRSRLTMR